MRTFQNLPSKCSARVMGICKINYTLNRPCSVLVFIHSFKYFLNSHRVPSTAPIAHHTEGKKFSPCFKVTLWTGQSWVESCQGRGEKPTGTSRSLQVRNKGVPKVGPLAAHQGGEGVTERHRDLPALTPPAIDPNGFLRLVSHSYT